LKNMGKTEKYFDQNEELVFLKHAVENTNEAFVTIDKDHKVLFFNKAAERIFGYDRKEVLGHDLDVIMASTCSRNHREAVARYVESRVPRRIGHETEILAMRKGGEMFPASISFSVAEVDGRMIFTGIVRDMTETRALQEKIMQSERLAALGQLVAEISHEIKNPLMMIGGFSRQLLRSVSDSKDRNKLEIISKEVKRLENLLADLREFHGRRALEAAPVDLHRLLQDTVAIVRENNPEKAVNIELMEDPDGRFVFGDEERLKQVFLNLIKNASEAVESGGNILIVTRVADDKVAIDIQDNGCGIPAEYQEKVLSPFFSTKQNGTGLGLCISKRIVEEHEGGGLEIDSQVGQGTTIHLKLPLYREAKSA